MTQPHVSDSASLPLMDIDALPDAVFGVDDDFLGNYLKAIDGQSGFLPSGSLDQEGWLGAAMQPHGSLSGGLAQVQSRGNRMPQVPRAPIQQSEAGSYMPPPPQPAPTTSSLHQQQLYAQRAVSAAGQYSAHGSTPRVAAHAVPSTFANPPQAWDPGAGRPLVAPAPHQYMQPAPQQLAQQRPQQQPHHAPYQHPWSEACGFHDGTAQAPSMLRYQGMHAPQHLPQRQAPAVPYMPRVHAATDPPRLHAQSYCPAPELPLRSGVDTALQPSSGTGRSNQTHDASTVSAAAHPIVKSEPHGLADGSHHLHVKSASADDSPPAAELDPPGTSGVEGATDAQLQGGPASAAGAEGHELAEGMQEMEEEPEDDAQAAAHAPAKPRGRRKMSARKVTLQRKQNNRKAQARYREKRKAQAADLEARVSELTQELESFSGVQERAQALQAENARLKSALALGRSSQYSEADGEDTLFMHSSACCEGMTEEYMASVAQLGKLKAQLRTLLVGAGIPVNAVQPEQTLSKETRQQLAELLAPCAHISMKQVMLAAKCPKETVLKHRMVEGTLHIGKEYKSRWCRIMSNLNLDSDQMEQIVTARRGAIEKLRATYEARCKLNQQAVYFMTHAFSPAAHALLGTKQTDDTVSVRMRAAEKYGECAAHSPMYNVLSELRDNLKNERKQFLHMHEVIIKQVLRPLQVAVMYIQAETDPLLPMSVSNLVAAHAGEPGLPHPQHMSYDCKKSEQRFMRPFMGSEERLQSSCDCSCEGCACAAGTSESADAAAAAQ